MYKVKLHARGQQFDYSCLATVTSLEAARDQFIPIPTGCKRGGCGMCKVKVLEGEYIQDIIRSHEALSDAELDNGYALACCMVPKSDMTIMTVEDYIKQEKLESTIG
ncbi:2Fe-2S iron-sulfur cluster-binding protein [Niallia oryzisoli]|uniref:2Fe-2S iron-sulfur cluster-binding protein n=1 Tax=Niallia oryzisoli TaxID=1737571 RepID=A0ABZ2C8Z9_9BACI